MIECHCGYERCPDFCTVEKFLKLAAVDEVPFADDDGTVVMNWPLLCDVSAG